MAAEKTKEAKEIEKTMNILSNSKFSDNGMEFKRVFTKEGTKPEDMFEYEERRSVIRNQDGSVVFEINNVEVPKFWTQVATDILAQKYFRKRGVPLFDSNKKPIIDPETKEQKTGTEQSIKQVAHRMALTWKNWGLRYGYFKTEKDAQIFYDETVYMLINQMAAPNSPQWFNTGLAEAYNIRGQPQGHYYADPLTGEVKKSEDAYSRPQPHACAEYHTQIYTEKGIKYIGEIVDKDMKGLKIFDGENYVKILATQYNGEKKVFRISLKNGNYLDLTKDHLVLGAKQRKKDGGAYDWTEVKDLNVGMKLQQPLVLDVKEQNVFAKQLAKARLAGWITGNGSVETYQNVMRLEIITTNDDEHKSVLEDIKEIFEEDVSYWITDSKTENKELKGKRIHLAGKKIENFVNEYELMNRSSNVNVSKKILQGAPQEKREFLKALFQADGRVRIQTDNENSADICLATVSDTLAFEVLQLLNSIGIYSRISVNKEKRDNRQDSNQIIISYGSAREQYTKQIGFISTEKQQKLALLNKIITKSKTLPLIKEETITEIKEIGIKKVYDIQTESEKFLANGVVVHNCFIQSINDDLVNEGGIFDLLIREARLFKYGSGTGTNFSKLRGQGERLSGGGKSSGLMSFLYIFDKAAGAIKSGGTTRRAAKMISLDLDHPDIEKFIDWKVKEEQKVAALVAGSTSVKMHLNNIMKIANQKKSVNLKENSELREAVKKALKSNVSINYIKRTLQLVKQGVKEMDFVEMNTHYESEAYQTVSGQNSNNSVRITNSFFEALSKNDSWKLLNRTDGKVSKTLNASDLWDKINYSAWMCADPGVQYDTTINEWHTCPKDGRINGSNPCSEYMFLDDTACNLASLNLMKYYDESKNLFKVDEFRHAVRIWTTILEISVLMAQFPGKEVARKSYLYRTLGLGFANIGTLLMMTGHPYDSDSGRSIAGAVSAIMGGEAYRTSAELARAQGPFERYEHNKKDMLRVIRNHKRAAYNAPNEEYEGLTIKPTGIDETYCPRYLLDTARKTWDEALELGQKHGYRNAQVTVIAPTGTIGLVMDCDTTGIEPDFALVKFKKLAGGGYLKIVNQSVPKALKNLKYTKEQINSIIKYAVGTGSLHNGSPHINKETLMKKGFTEEKIKAVEEHLPSSFELKYAFSKWTLGAEFLKDIGFSEEQMNNPDLNVLEALGFDKKQIAEAEKHICGRMTVEGAPNLKQEHYAVFDCANKCGKNGTRYIEYMGHINMLSSVQPFISGAISKTINMDATASIKDVGDAYMESWKKMIKAVALYRDGSKLSQPLNASSADESELLMLKDEEMVDETITPKQMHEAAVIQIKQRKMPSKRTGFVQEAIVGGQKVFLRTGDYEDGSLGEIFIDTYKEGASYGALLNCFAIAISKGLQHGVPLSNYVDAFTFTRFEPSGPVIGHPAIKNATSIIDYVFRLLGYEYLGRKDFVHVKSMESFDKKGSDEAEKKVEKQQEKQMTITSKDAKVFEAKAKGYTGEQCSSCGSMKLRRNGSCMVCEDCGETTGCS